MIRIAKLPASLILCLSVGLVSCGGSTQKNEADLLLGKWVLQEALRNGKPTESLDELYFEFYEDGQMNTNLAGEDQTGVYELEGGVIRQRETGMDVDYQLLELSDSALVLSTQLRDFSFRFTLRRKLQEE